MIEKIVSVATIDDLRVWSLGAHYVKKYINASEYRLIVPGKYVDVFTKRNNNDYLIMPEEDVLPLELIKKIKNYFDNTGVSYGWYLQQFLKIEELRKQSSNIALIWDADTIPTKCINFEDDLGRILSYKAAEYHAPYFETIEKILGIKRNNNHSFISQCICVKMIDVYNMCDQIEQRSGERWIESIMKAIIPKHGYFSEYETIGTYVSSRHCETKFFYKSPESWTRNGYKYIPSLSLYRFLYKIYSKRFDHITFEKWGRKDYGQKLMRLLIK